MSNLRDAKPKVITITLNDGVERELRFTLNAMAELEDRYGTIQAAFDALDNNSIKAIRCVLWAGLLHADEALSEQQVGALLDMRNLGPVVASLADALSADQPELIEGAQSPNV